MLGEIGEEQLIAALDLAVVQAQIRPGMTAGEFTKQIYDTTIATLFASAGPSALHGAQVHKDVVMENAAVMEGHGETDASINTAGEDAALAPEQTTGEGDQPSPPVTGSTESVAPPPSGRTSGIMLSPGVLDTFIRSSADPDARVPESEKIHRNIEIVRPKAAGTAAPLDITSNEAAPHRDAFDQRHHQAEGFEIRKEFIPANTEEEARAEYARRHGHAGPLPDWKADRVSAWVDDQGNATSFRDPRERDSWREDQIRSNYITANRGGNGPTESANLTYEDAVKDHPFLEDGRHSS